MKHRGIFPYTTRSGKLRQSVRLAGPDGEMRRYGSYATVQAAIRARDQIQVQRDQEDLSDDRRIAAKLTVDQEIDAYLLTVVKKRAKKDQLYFGKWWKERFFGAKVVRWIDVRPAQIEQARAALDARGASAARINRYTDWLRHVFNWSKRQGRYFRDNPVLAIDRHTEDRVPPYPYSMDQLKALLRELGDQADIFVIAVLTNLRQANQFRLRKDQVFLDGLRGILVPTTKNGKFRFVPLSVPAIAILRRQIAKSDPTCPYVYPGQRRRGKDQTVNPLNPRWFYARIFKPACGRAGIPVDQIDQLWHSARDTFGSLLADMGYQEHQIMKSGGWSDTKAVRHYVEMADPTVREAMERLAARVLSGTASLLPATENVASAESELLLLTQELGPVAQLDRAAVS